MSEATELTVAEFKASAAVVSALYWDRAFRQAATPIVTAEMFPTKAEGFLATLLCELGDDVDESRVLMEVERREKSKLFPTEAGATSQTTVLDVLMGGPHVADPMRELDRLREITALRKLRHGLMEVERRVGAYEVSLGEASTVIGSLLTAASANAGVRIRKLGEAVADALQRTMAAAQGEGIRHVKTGFPMLDENTGGIHVDNSWVFGAFTNWGKSTSLIALYLAARAQGFRPLIVSGEDAEDLYARRVLGRLAQVNPARLRDGGLDTAGWSRALDVSTQIGTDPLPFFLDGRGKSSEQIVRETRGAIAAEGIDFVLVDYLQVWRPRERTDRRNEVADLASGFTDAIKTAPNKCAGVLFSQLTGEKGEEPSKESLRESKDVGHRAEVIVLGWTDKSGQRWFLLDKNKDGPCPVRVPVWWDPASASIIPEEPGTVHAQEDLPYGGL